jgi:hypothetical protein
MQVYRLSNGIRLKQKGSAPDPDDVFADIYNFNRRKARAS